MELNEIIEDKKELTEVIKDIEEIAQRLASLHVSMRILATHCLVINTLSTDEFKTLKITEEELWKLTYVNRRNRSSVIRRVKLFNICISRRSERSITKY